MKITFGPVKLPNDGALALAVAEGGKLLGNAKALDKKTGGALRRALSVSRFKGKPGEILDVVAPPKVKNSRILLVGVGAPGKAEGLAVESIGGAVTGHLNRVGEASAAVVLDAAKDGSAAGETAALAAYGALLSSYRFDRYRTKEKPEKKPTLKTLTFQTADVKGAKKAYGSREKIAGGVFLTRDLVSEPANIIYPKSFVARVKAVQKLGVKVKVLGKAEMTKLGMGALLGVGQGSAQESQMLVMEWRGAPKARNKQPVAFVGKGVTFDTGGISIKPAAGMEDMKWDMGGAGVVAGLMHALAARKAKANVVGICGLVENMPSSTAQRPGDIVTSMSGQTIEVINTDAEGRLVLADALWYVQEKYRPRAIVDLATLTGAVIISLGHEYAGLFSNNDKLSEQLTTSGTAVGEGLWRLPMGDAYDKLINSDAADMKNVGNRAGGSITAAQFLERFIQNDTPWAHLDIAGVAWSNKDKPTVPKGGTGFGVRLLDNFVAENYES